MEIKLEEPNNLESAVNDFLEQVKGNNVFAFDGQMGAGKTTFILAALKSLGISAPDGSPTYAIVNSYTTPVGSKLYHVDAYRLENEDEALDVGMEDILYGDAMCFIEWPEKIKDLLPDTTIWSYIRINDDNSRSLIIDI